MYASDNVFTGEKVLTFCIVLDWLAHEAAKEAIIADVAARPDCGKISPVEQLLAGKDGFAGRLAFALAETLIAEAEVPRC